MSPLRTNPIRNLSYKPQDGLFSMLDFQQELREHYTRAMVCSSLGKLGECQSECNQGHADHEERGVSFHEIATMLSEKGIKPRKGKQWHFAYVRYILIRTKESKMVA